MSTVEVYCQDASHEARRAKVAEFGKSCYPCDILECETQSGSRAHVEEWILDFSPGQVTPDWKDPRRQVRGHAPNRRDRIVARYRLECPLCGLNATAGEARFYSILDTLVAAGIDRIPLGLLAARMQSSK